MLVLQGTRDPLCDMEPLEPTLSRLSTTVTLHRIEGGDHSFKVPKRSGRTEANVWEKIVDTISDKIE
jgi:alpha-beta hydrolase superfamily lysophospholipase